MLIPPTVGLALGLPQRSVLGQRLFILYTADLAEVVGPTTVGLPCELPRRPRLRRRQPVILVCTLSSRRL